MSKYISNYLSNDICNIIYNYLMQNKNTIKKSYKRLLSSIYDQYDYFKIRKNEIEIIESFHNQVVIFYKCNNTIVPWNRNINDIPLQDIIKYSGNKKLIQIWKNNYHFHKQKSN